MADKMMRVAGRGKDGTAKALSVDNAGKLLLSGHAVLLSESDSSQGREIAGTTTWESSLFDVTELETLHVGTSVNTGNQYTVSVTEYSHIGSKLFELKKTDLTNGAVKGNVLVHMPLTVETTKIRIYIKNNDATPIRIGLIAYGGRIKTNTFYDKEKRKFEFQSQYATEETLEKVAKSNSAHKVILSESDSSQGREIAGNTTWESPLFDITDLESIHVGTSLSTGNYYNLTIKEYSHIGSKIFETNVADLTNGAVKGNVLRSMPLRTDTNKIRIYVANLGNTPTRVGLIAYGGKIKPNTFYNQEKTAFDTQSEVATENTLAKIFNQLLNQSRNTVEKKYPVLSDVKVIEDPPVRFITGSDGEYFYAGDAERQGKLLRSKDGVDWELIHTFNHIGGSLTMVMVGDEGHMTVGFGSGYVYVSDENGVFPSEPTIITSAIEAMFGRFKHANVMGFSSYAKHGFDDGQKHEAFLSTDNGKTYRKVFSNATFNSLPPLADNRVHLHDFEYDPYSGRLYLWNGDFENRTLNYSDDWGRTWEQAFPRGAVDNATQIIATQNGVSFGADTGGGGYAFLPLDRSSNIKPILDVNNYIDDYWEFNRDGGRFIAGRSFVDRKNGIYLTPYITEPTTGLDKNSRTGFLAYSNDGENWSIIWQSPDMNDWTGLETIEYVNGVLVGTYSKGGDNRPRSTFIAKVDLS